jgi:hypothetical protein
MKTAIKVLQIFVLFVLSYSVIYPQTYGKLYSKDQANVLFGTVSSSVQINNSDIQSAINRTKNVLMFKIVNGIVYILDNKRNVLSPAGSSVSSSEPFHMFSVSLINELLDKGKSTFNTVEFRGDVLSITNGNFTLEFSTLCPPFCPPKD